VIFWGAGCTKESVVMGCLGILLRSMWLVGRRRNPLSLVGVVFAGVGIAVLKAYTLVAVVVAASAFVYADSAWRGGGPIRVRPGVLLLSIALGVGGVAAIGSVFPDLRPDRVAESVANLQGTWQATHDAGYGGGSDTEVGSGEARGPIQQLAFVPVAAANVFFRPVLFEAHGAPMFGAALESTLLALALLSMLRVGRRTLALQAVIRTPLLVFAVVFCAIFGVGVGLATSNLGTLSRYRMPMMSFYAATVLIVRDRLKALAATSAVRARPALRAQRSRPV
jgi:hypothetical protein